MSARQPDATTPCYGVHAAIAQDGARVWVVARVLEGCRQLTPIAEYMSESAAIRGAHDLNEAAEKASALQAAAL